MLSYIIAYPKCNLSDKEYLEPWYSKCAELIWQDHPNHWGTRLYEGDEPLIDLLKSKKICAHMNQKQIDHSLNGNVVCKGNEVSQTRLACKGNEVSQTRFACKCDETKKIINKYIIDKLLKKVPVIEKEKTEKPRIISVLQGLLEWFDFEQHIITLEI